MLDNATKNRPIPRVYSHSLRLVPTICMSPNLLITLCFAMSSSVVFRTESENSLN